MLVAKKKINSKLLYLFILITMIGISFFRGINVHAETLKGSAVPVTYTKNESISYPLVLEVRGSGTVFDGNKNIKNSNEGYLLKIDESMNFKLNPDKNARVSRIILNGESIKDKIENNEITVEGQEKEQKLIVEFTDANNDMSQTGDSNAINGMPQTGDSNNIMIYLLVLLISIIGFILLNRKSKHKKQ